MGLECPNERQGTRKIRNLFKWMGPACLKKEDLSIMTTAFVSFRFNVYKIPLMWMLLEGRDHDCHVQYHPPAGRWSDWHTQVLQRQRSPKADKHNYRCATPLMLVSYELSWPTVNVYILGNLGTPPVEFYIYISVSTSVIGHPKLEYKVFSPL